MPPSTDPDDEPETPEAAAATRKVMALVAISLVSVIDVASYLYARPKPGVFALIALPMVVVTLAVAVFAWRALKIPPAEQDPGGG